MCGRGVEEFCPREEEEVVRVGGVEGRERGGVGRGGEGGEEREVQEWEVREGCR